MATDDEQLICEVLNGDPEAFGFLVKKYEKPIFNLMFRATGSVEDAADLAQDAFLKAYDKIDTYTPGRKFYSWLYTIAFNVARDFLRKGNRMPESIHHLPDRVLESENAFQCPPEAERNAEIQSLFKALSSLPIDYREALVLRFREDMSIKDVARILGLSTSGVKMRIHRGLEKLRKIIQ